MWCASLSQVFQKNPQNLDYECWVILLRIGSGTTIEKEIRAKHEKIDTILAAHNVNYSEITTFQGKQEFYEKFQFKSGKHPMFFIFNKHPLKYAKKEPFMVIEWGKWSNLESFKNDLMALVTFFSDAEFRKKIATAQNKTMWSTVSKFLIEHGIDLIGLGATIAGTAI
jgi:hypothetical protein